VQGEFVSNFSGYSAISVRDREHLEAEVYRELTSPSYDDKEVEKLWDLGRLTPTTHFMGGKITKTAKGYALQMNITKTDDKTTVASYSGTFTFAELDDLTGIRRASLELLQKMGVALSNKAKEELGGAATENRVNAQTALAMGITEKRQGADVAALIYFNQAEIYDPSLAEAVNRSSVMAANVSSGNIGANARTFIALYEAWTKRLEETERYIDHLNKTVSMPYTLFYSDTIIEGGVYVEDKAMDLTIKTKFYGSSNIKVWALSVEKALQAVYDGFEAAKKEASYKWDLNWPSRPVTNLNSFGTQYKKFTIVAELVNSRNKVLGKFEFKEEGFWEYSMKRGRMSVDVGTSDDNYAATTLTFKRVKLNDITDNLTIRITSVNGEPAETAARKGILQIRAMRENEFSYNSPYKFAFGTIIGSNWRDGNLIIPDTIWGDRVISIKKSAFYNNKLRGVTIPNSVTYIGESAFSRNQLTAITIGANVDIDRSAFDNEFGVVYVGGGRKGGTYIYEGKTWTREKTQTEIELELQRKEVRMKLELQKEKERMEELKRVSELQREKERMELELKKVGTWDCGATPGTVKATLSDGTLTISGTGAMVDYIHNVIAPWYSSQAFITNVIIENGVTSIGRRAFYNCTGLTSVTIPNSVTSIGVAAFRGCSDLRSVTIPNRVTSIGDGAFWDCNGLTSIITLNPTPLTLQKEVFYKIDMTKVCLYVPSRRIAAYRSAEGWKEFSCIKDKRAPASTPSMTVPATTPSLTKPATSPSVAAPASTSSVAYKIFVDRRNGNSYKTVKIGEQTWMAENLYANKKIVNKVRNIEYGSLYSWAGAMHACPAGWHLPSDDEWQKLVDYAGGKKAAGKKLKSTTGWNNNGNGTDEHGFSALPGGLALPGGTHFLDAGNYGYWWSASALRGSDDASRWSIGKRSEAINRRYIDKTSQFSVRCVQDY